MRIGFEMLAAQSPHHGHRGIGRYSASLVSTLLRREDEHQYILYVHDGLPDTRVPTSTRARIRRLKSGDPGDSRLLPVLDRLARTNPDDLDVLVVLSPFEKWSFYTPPAREPGGLPIAAVVYDLIPFLFQNEFHVDPELVRHYRNLEELTRYDVLLAISNATRHDCLSVLNLAPERVVNISGASDPSFFQPAPDQESWSAATRTMLNRLGVERPFVFNVGGLDPRKNTWMLIDAFALLPARVRAAHQLVLTFSTTAWGRDQVIAYARDRGVGSNVLVTGEVSDHDLRLLYQHCAAFVFPSTYEGFGLPILEAMHCGAPVLAGNNSSQIEVVGDAGLLAEAGDPQDIAAKLGRLLDEDSCRAMLRERALVQSNQFHWDRTASRTLDALNAIATRPARPAARPSRGSARKPTIAFFSPLPPRKSGISDYARYLLDELRSTYRIDLYHDSGYVPEPALGSSEFRACDYRLFDRFAAAKDYHGIVYQMGNSHYHGFMYEMMLRHPGVVTLHDFCLAGFHLHQGHARGRGYGFLRDTLMEWYPESRGEISDVADAWPADWEAIARDCSRRGWFVNRHLIASCEALVVHSPWCRDQVASTMPQWLDRVAVIPHGMNERRFALEQRREVRAAFGLPEEALIVASFGFIHRDKMSLQALEAFASVRKAIPRELLFIFVGEDADAGRAQSHAAALGLGDSVRFLGRQPMNTFMDLMAVADVGVNLRMPPTNGETSGALLFLLAAGVPTLVTDVGTFSDYPSNVVQKVFWEREGQAGLTRCLHDLVGDQEARSRLGASARSHVHEYHSWSRVAAQYVETIERCHAARASAARRIHRTGQPIPQRHAAPS